jgi:hypothetical protein
MGSAKKTDFSAALLTMRSTPPPVELAPHQEEPEVAPISEANQQTIPVQVKTADVVPPEEPPPAVPYKKEATVGSADGSEPTHAFTIRLPRSLHTQWSLALKSEPLKVSGAAKIEELIRAYVASRKASIKEMIRRNGY